MIADESYFFVLPFGLGAYFYLGTTIAVGIHRTEGQKLRNHWSWSWYQHADANLLDGKCLMIGSAVAFMICILVPYKINTLLGIGAIAYTFHRLKNKCEQCGSQRTLFPARIEMSSKACGPYCHCYGVKFCSQDCYDAFPHGSQPPAWHDDIQR